VGLGWVGIGFGWGLVGLGRGGIGLGWDCGGVGLCWGSKGVRVQLLMVGSVAVWKGSSTFINLRACTPSRRSRCCFHRTVMPLHAAWIGGD
jgi:hypothetical protein